MQMNEDSLQYLEETLKPAPFKSVLMLLKKKRMEEHFNNINNLLQQLGRKPVRLD
jgi:hypothetical protein